MKSIENIVIIGAGFMGAGIAQVAAEAGYHVCLNDISMEAVNNALQSIRKRWTSKAERGKITNETLVENISRLTGNINLEEAVKNADFVIEAVVEKLEVKAQIFERISKICSDDVILASNTSSMSITALGAYTRKPENFIGTHFFSPVPVMKLLEIIPGLCTSSETLEAVKLFGEKIQKKCIVSKDSAGFIVNRMLDPMLNEAIQLLDDKVGTVEDIDAGMKFGCAHPMGPFELLDMAGIDIELAVMEVLYAETGDQKYRPAPLLRKMVRAGYIGKKVGKGFYIYNEDGTKTPNPIFE